MHPSVAHFSPKPVHSTLWTPNTWKPTLLYSFPLPRQMLLFLSTLPEWFPLRFPHKFSPVEWGRLVSIPTSTSSKSICPKQLHKTLSSWEGWPAYLCYLFSPPWWHLSPSILLTTTSTHHPGSDSLGSHGPWRPLFPHPCLRALELMWPSSSVPVLSIFFFFFPLTTILVKLQYKICLLLKTFLLSLRSTWINTFFLSLMLSKAS